MADREGRSLERQAAVGDEDAKRRMLIKQILRGIKPLVDLELLEKLPPGEIAGWCVYEEDGKQYPVIQWRVTQQSFAKDRNLKRNDIGYFDIQTNKLVTVRKHVTAPTTVVLGQAWERMVDMVENVSENPHIPPGQMFMVPTPARRDSIFYRLTRNSLQDQMEMFRSQMIVMHPTTLDGIRRELARAEQELRADRNNDADHALGALRYACHAALRNVENQTNRAMSEVERELTQDLFRLEYEANYSTRVSTITEVQSADPEAED